MSNALLAQKNYQLLTPTVRPSNSLIVDCVSKLRPIDVNDFTLAIGPYPIALEAQEYYDNLDLVEAVRTAPDLARTRMPSKNFLFTFKLQTRGLRELATRNLPTGKGRNDFVDAILVCAGMQEQLLGGSAEFRAVVNLEGPGLPLHHDNGPIFRSLWQPNSPTDPAATTIFADDAVAKNRLVSAAGKLLNNYGALEETDPKLLFSAAAGSLGIWACGRFLLPRIHAEPAVPHGTKPRFTLIGDRHV